MGLNVVSNTPSLSVLMSVYNGERYLARSLDSLIAQTFTDFEILIADDQSTDLTPQIMARYAAMDSRIRLLRGSREGLGVVRNLLVREAAAPLLAWLDGDDIALPTRLEKQVAFMHQNPDVIAAGTSVRVVDEDGEVIKDDIRATDHETIDKELIEYLHNAIFFPSSIVRADAVAQVNGFRREFPVGCDTDLWLRLAEIGRLANLEEILLEYRWHAESNSWKVPLWQRDRAMLAINDARRRRGLKAFELTSLPHSRQNTPRAQIHDTWAAVALNHGNLSTARKHAWKAIKHCWRQPRAWRTLSLACFPIESDRDRSRITQPFVSLIRRGCFAISRMLDSPHDQRSLKGGEPDSEQSSGVGAS